MTNNITSAKQVLTAAEAQQVRGGIGNVNFQNVGEGIVNAAYVFIHKNCGGHIRNVGNWKKSCYCDKCGESHYFIFFFSYDQQAKE